MSASRAVDRSAFSIDDSVDLGGQTAAGTSHATIVNILFSCGSVLVHPDTGTVDHDDIARTPFLRYRPDPL
jgi:hypothetical protein